MVRRCGPLSSEEMSTSMHKLTKICQPQAFLEKLSCLLKGKEVNPGSRLASLNPFLDDNRVLHVNGRLRNADLTYNQKFPIILSAKHPFTKLIIRHAHIKSLHTGPHTTLPTVRENYFPLNGIGTLKSVECNVFEHIQLVYRQKWATYPNFESHQSVFWCLTGARQRIMVL